MSTIFDQKYEDNKWVQKKSVTYISGEKSQNENKTITIDPFILRCNRQNAHRTIIRIFKYCFSLNAFFNISIFTLNLKYQPESWIFMVILQFSVF